MYIRVSPTTVMLLHVATAKGSWQFCVSRLQTSAFPITLDHTSYKCDILY